ncbi:MAG: TIGR03986 family CRISPR-associated RAMP protein [Rhizobium sp.]
MAVWISGTILDDEGDLYFIAESGQSFKISGRAEDAYNVVRGNPALKDGLRLEASVNDRDAKLEALRVPAPAGPHLKRGDFHNPYNFIPAPPFKPDPAPASAASGMPAGGLEQGPPAGHHRWHEDRYSGRIHLEIEAVTPLLIPDPHPEAAARDHKIFRTLRDGEGKPVMPVTSLKGALRSAYEAITNSRMGVMDGEDRLAYREPTDAALKKVPCRLEEIRADGTATFALYDDRSGKGHFGMAWFPVDKRSDSELVLAHRNHLGAAKAMIAPVRFDVKNGKTGATKESLPIYSVLDFQFENGRDRHPRPARSFSAKLSPKTKDIEHHYTPNGTPFPATGYLLASNVRNFSSHHDERFFFVRDDDVSREAFEDNKLHVSREEFRRLDVEWSNLIRNARAQNEKAMRKERPSATGKHSRHLYDEPPERDGTRLKPGDMFYVTLPEDGARENRKITAMSPVQISRALYTESPRELLHASLHPAQGLNELSPADRVFGWAHERGNGAFRGQARIAPVRFVSGKGITPFDEPLPLAIMGEPKPAQWLFYGAEDQTGKPLPKGAAAGVKGYQKDRGIRGRKTYPHQSVSAAASTYWDQVAALENARQSIQATTEGDAPPSLMPMPANGGLPGVYLEYVRLKGRHTKIGKNGRVTEEDKSNTDSQNRSIRDWVEPGSVFSTSIDVTNLSREELGALLWLLDLNAAEGPTAKRRYHLKFGGGKPLGFGSVAVRILNAEIWSGKAKAKSLADFAGKPEALSDAEQQALVGEYRSWMARHYGGEFGSIPFIAGFLQSAAGYDDGLPTHYPRLSEAPDPVGENFRWFVANMKGDKAPLPGIVKDPGLPRKS